MKWTFVEMADRMRELQRVLESLGLETETSRLTTIIRTIEHAERGRLLGNVDDIDDDQTLWSMTEAIELADIYRSLKGYNREILRRKFRDVLQGPGRPKAEDANSNHGRNTAFELSMAARFHEQGVFRELLDNPDVLCESGGVQIYVQCKRPLNEKRIRRNIARARAQLRADLGTRRYPDACGIIAISLTRIISPRSALLWGTQSVSALREAYRTIDAIANPYADAAREDPGVIATVFHVMMPVLTVDADRPSGRLGSVDVPVIYRHNPGLRDETDLLHRMFGPPAQ